MLNLLTRRYSEYQCLQHLFKPEIANKAYVNQIPRILLRISNISWDYIALREILLNRRRYSTADVTFVGVAAIFQ